MRALPSARSCPALAILLVVASTALLPAGGARAQDAAHDEVAAADEPRLSIAAVPTLNYNSDEGFGFGGVGTLYHHAEGARPYKDAVTLNIFVSSKLVQAHQLRWDGLRPFGLPIRVYARLGYYSTLTQNFCGFGNAVACDEGDARAAAARLKVGEADLERFVARYHRLRFMRPFAELTLRHPLREKPHRIEALVGWRGAYMIPGEIGALGPYPGSLFAELFPDGQPGPTSVVQAGFVLDDRDREVAPRRGYVVEATLRGGGLVTGSAWTYGGGNVTAALFTPLSRGGRLVLAQRVMGDLLVGEPPMEEMARTGGLLEVIHFGGHALGRGIREHRYLGKVKVMHQIELRGMFFDVRLFEQDLVLGAAAFHDAAWLGYDLSDWRGSPAGIVQGAGAGARIQWNENFMLRWDLATSPVEDGALAVYIQVGDVF